jgi:hypothetical protein
MEDGDMLPTLKDWLPTLGIVLTASLGLVTYAWQEKVKQQTALAERRRGLYEQLIRNLVELLVANTGAERSKFITEIEKGWLFASDDVLRASYAYLSIYDKLRSPPDRTDGSTFGDVLGRVRSDSEVRHAFAQSLAAVFLAMRRDIRSETVISPDWAKQHFQIYLWGIIAKDDDLRPERPFSLEEDA